MIIKIDNCNKCPFCSKEREQGFTLEICSHPERNTYNYCMPNTNKIPNFCPLKDESVEIEIDWKNKLIKI